ncbi:Guanine nucleotide-binding protein subunit alpha-13 [Larimichthys crocea]|uniref:Uncharacterized protein n=1 Tax=Larimichthys crocea TaxID=215358 RepID=A0ACD3RSG4_LARCR|nr:Guanine nucleotide-binding protein subunit alpha-13 [Larimichthys crocea]
MADFLPTRSVLKVCLPVCLLNNGEVEQLRKSKEIDRCLSREKTYVKRLVKILLLGAGESGKSTFLKQMRIIHGQDFDQQAREDFKGTIYSNVIKGELGWLDGQGESVKYFLDNLDKLGEPSYLPTQQDILLARKPTKGIHEYDFEIKNVPFKMVDVGGQRSERRRWFECFDSVTSILFLVSSSEYDQVLMEDRQTNRLRESLNIFETIVNNRVFANVSIILFLNKTDLLEEKVKSVPLKDYFPEYTGTEHSLPDIQAFMVECFPGQETGCHPEAPVPPLHHSHQHGEHQAGVPGRQGHHPPRQPQTAHAAMTPVNL